MGRRRLKKPVPMMGYEYEANPRVRPIRTLIPNQPGQSSKPVGSLTPDHPLLIKPKSKKK